ncbi:MAG: TIGR00282 family metallophosphoesterase [Ruminococcus sp.]|nr:TIGR00282 family metallophosphoesterase [Ruminococcus sp.]
MKIFCIGDVVGMEGRRFLRQKLPAFKKEHGVDLVICNGENSSNKNGISNSSCDYLFASGIDVITLGNHAFRRMQIFDYLENQPYLIRPLNFPSPSTPGKGICTLDMGFTSVTVINLMGQEGMSPICESPFIAVDRALKAIDSKIILVDFHAEATSEKKAMGYFLDGRVSAVFGTHTHVQTSDEAILAGGTGYITDLGMTGVIDSVLGVKKEIILRRFVDKRPEKFELAEGECMLNGVLFEIDEKTGRCISVSRYDLR